MVSENGLKESCGEVASDMITAKQVRDLITANPFKPFRVYLSDGRHYDVTHRDMAIIERNIPMI